MARSEFIVYFCLFLCAGWELALESGMEKPHSDPLNDQNEPGEQLSLEQTRVLAEGGDAEAQFSMGLSLTMEDDGPDYVEAAKWYSKAADQNHPLAQFNLGIMHARGQGMARDAARSLFWLGRAARLGDAGAQFELGMRRNRNSMDENSVSGCETRIEAYKWLLLAAGQGYGAAANGCEFVAMDMTHADVIEGRRRAASFVPGPTQ
jgi:TPR repeat protein